jgi:hypothetical protein
MGITYKDYPIVMLSSKHISYNDKALYHVSGALISHLVYGHINDDLHNTHGATRRLLYVLDPLSKILKGDWYYIHDVKTSEHAICHCDTDRLEFLCVEYKDKATKIIATNDKSLNLPLISGSDQQLYARNYTTKKVDVVSLYLDDEKVIVKETGNISIKGFYKKNKELEDSIYQAIGLSADPKTGIINQSLATKKVMEILNKYNE